MEFDSLVQKKKINLSGRDICDADINVLAEVVQKSTVLEDLNLMLNDITLADGRLTDAIAENETLRILSLYNNKIGADGARRLAGALKVSKTIEQLNLEGNQIGDEGTRSLAEALKLNSTLEVMILRGNSIGDAGAADLATAFLFNKSLRVILLGENEISNAGAQSLAHSLECNPIIDQIMLDSNPMSNVMELKIRNVLTKPSRKNPSGQASLPKTVVEHLMAEKDKAMEKKDAELKVVLSKITKNEVLIASMKKMQEDLAAKNRKIERRDAALTSKSTEIAKRDRKLAQKDEQIAALEKTLNSPLELLVMFIERKDNEISSLKAAIETMAQQHQDAAEEEANAEESDDDEEEEESDDDDSESESEDDDSEYDDSDDENKDPVENVLIRHLHNKNTGILQKMSIKKYEKVSSTRDGNRW